MAKYRYICPRCNNTVQRIATLSSPAIACKVCNTNMDRQFPTLNGPSSVTEVINKYTGTTWRPNQKEEVKQRRDEYYWSVEVPRFVNSGVYSMETMLENGWIWLDDNGQIHTHTKPPNTR